MKKAILLLLVIGSTILLKGCVGSPVHSTITYSNIQSLIKRNNFSLVKLETGMSERSSQNVLGEPSDRKVINGALHGYIALL